MREYVILFDVMKLIDRFSQLNQHTQQIKRLKEHSGFRRVMEGSKDAGSIVKIIRDMGLFLERFQVTLSNFCLGSVFTPCHRWISP